MLELHERAASNRAAWAQALSIRLKAAGPDDEGAHDDEPGLVTLEDLVIGKRLSATSELAEPSQARIDACVRPPMGGR